MAQDQLQKMVEVCTKNMHTYMHACMHKMAQEKLQKMVEVYTKKTMLSCIHTCMHACIPAKWQTYICQTSQDPCEDVLEAAEHAIHTYIHMHTHTYIQTSQDPGEDVLEAAEHAANAYDAALTQKAECKTK